MRISHVIRGDDHLSNTPKQALLYDALGVPRPKFAHISMILGTDKARLSKRHGATSTLAYRDMGYLPGALINYLARLGWSHGDQELFTIKEMIEHFTLENVTTSSAVFNPEKLLWVNEQWIQKMPPLELAAHLEPILRQEKVLPEGHGRTMADIARVIPALNQRAKTLIDMAHGAEFYFKSVFIDVPLTHIGFTGHSPKVTAGEALLEYDEKAVRKFLIPEVKPLFEKLIIRLEPMSEQLKPVELENLFKKITEEEDIKLGKLAQPVRVALTGKTASPGIYDVMEILGNKITVDRLKIAINHIKAKTS